MFITQQEVSQQLFIQHAEMKHYQQNSPTSSNNSLETVTLIISLMSHPNV